MATDVDISINIKDHSKFNKQKALSLMSYLVEEKILTLKGDLKISVDHDKLAEPVTSLGKVADIISSGRDDYLYCFMEFTGEYGTEKHDNKLTDLVNEILDASVKVYEENDEYSSACIYTASFKHVSFEIEDGIHITECGFFFGGDGWLDAQAIANKLKHKKLYSSLVNKLEEIFESEIYFDVQVTG